MSKIAGGILLVAGTQIGAGMLALPITTGVTGLWCALIVFLCCFAFMLTSLFYVMEASLMTDKEDANLISMVRERLGMSGVAIAYFSFLLLLYAVAAAYLSGGGSLITDLLNVLTKTHVKEDVGIFLFLCIFGFIVVFGMKGVDRINRLCVIGLILTFLGLLLFVTPHVRFATVKEGNTRYIWTTIPIVILSFTSHIVVPSLRTYFHGDVKKLKSVFLIGSVIPLIFYVVWECMIIGLLPHTEGPYSLEAIARGARPVSGLTTALRQLVHVAWIPLLVGLFSFFALVTSFFGVSLSLYDFLADGLNIRKHFKGQLLLIVMMFTPPMLFALFYPKGFTVALGYGGVFIAILYGILPVLMVWQGRYVAKKRPAFRVIGGKPLMVAMIFGALLIIFLQVAATKGYLPSL